jgi:hypothetical protein
MVVLFQVCAVVERDVCKCLPASASVHSMEVASRLAEGRGMVGKQRAGGERLSLGCAVLCCAACAGLGQAARAVPHRLMQAR